MNTQKHIIHLLGFFVALIFLVTGCAKDELIPPAGDTLDSFKSIEQIEDMGSNDRPVDTQMRDSDILDSDGITDDEDDEDDEDREENR
ncbi:MAG: hypothetical protein HKN79_01400 [Flavobacteriales bacterium]|nr:hypothetical protein [Flavobacteriales bacterium]